MVLKYVRADGCDLVAEVVEGEGGLTVQAMVAEGISIEEADEVIDGWLECLSGDNCQKDEVSRHNG
jgi:hypothetical protein